jgi:hypothetical protein
MFSSNFDGLLKATNQELSIQGHLANKRDRQISGPLLVAMCAAITIHAAQPPLCNSCNLSFGPSTTVFTTPSGSTVYFSVRIGNAGESACDQTNLTVFLSCPGPTLGTFGPTNLIRSGLALPAGTPPDFVRDTNGAVILVPCLVMAESSGVTLLKALAFATNNSGGCQLTSTNTANAFGTTSITPYDWPQIISTRTVGGAHEIACATVEQRSYVLEYSDTLTNWQTLTGFVATARTTILTDPTAAPSRFYRLMMY